VLDAPFDAYLARLGLDAAPPSADALFRIHRAHVERVPYETVWIHVGERWSVDAADAVTRIATQQRGGYCFHLNGAMSELLRALGYDVVRHVGGVHGPDGPAEDVMTNHLVLTVHGLPTDANPEGDWYVDAGLGDALYEPLPLRAGSYQQGPFRLVLDATPGAVGDWHLTHDPEGSFTGMSWRSASTDLDVFAPRNEFLQTSPESGFVKVLTVQRRDATGVDILRGLAFERVGTGASESTITSRDEFGDVLGDVFGLHLNGFDESERDALWTKLRDAHERWVAAGRP
jgi:N-hydroxyarylamine O-acetyltransferase